MSEEIRRHAGNVPKQSLYFYFLRIKSSASKISIEKMLSFFLEEIMKPAGFVPNHKRLIVSSEKNIHFFSEAIMRHAGFLPHNRCLSIFSEEIMLIFSEEIMRHAALLTTRATLFLQKKMPHFFLKK